MGEEVRELVRLRCGNMEEGNKYWLDEEYREYVFCRIRIDWYETLCGGMPKSMLVSGIRKG